MNTLKRLNKAVEKKLSEAVKGTATIAVYHGCHLLMGQRRDNGKWTGPGGGLDPNETPIMGAIRELKEEAGIVAESLEPVYDEIVTGRSGRSVHVYCYRYYAHNMQTSTVNDPDKEVENWQWINITNGLPPEILNNLQSPKNLLLQKIGLQGA